MNLAEGYELRFGAALAASVVVHAGALMLSLPAPRLQSSDASMPLSVHLVQEPVAPVAELARPSRATATKAARAKPAPRKREEAPAALTTAPDTPSPAESTQVEAAASAPEPVASPPIVAPPPSPPEAIALLAPAQPPPAPSDELIARYTKSLSEVFARYKEYPRIAEMRGWEGSVTMRLRVAPSGRLIGAELYKSSGYEALDKQAMTMVSRVGVLPAPPEGLNAAEVPVLVPINFRLQH